MICSIVKTKEIPMSISEWYEQETGYEYAFRQIENL